MSSPPLSVLLAEDDFLVAEATTYALQSAGHGPIWQASDGEEALRLTCERRPDVVVMDIQMPGIDGIEAALRIQQHCPTPVVILSAHDTEELVTRATAAGVGAFLTKPAAPQSLGRALEIARARHGDLMRQRALVAELSAQRGELERALATIETLHGTLPVCMFCRQIRDGDDWLSLEAYLDRRTAARVSHGLCPACQARHFPDTDVD